MQFIDLAAMRPLRAELAVALVGLAAWVPGCGAEVGAHVATLDGAEGAPVPLRVGSNVSPTPARAARRRQRVVSFSA